VLLASQLGIKVIQRRFQKTLEEVRAQMRRTVTCVTVVRKVPVVQVVCIVNARMHSGSFSTDSNLACPQS